MDKHLEDILRMLAIIQNYNDSKFFTLDWGVAEHDALVDVHNSMNELIYKIKEIKGEK